MQEDVVIPEFGLKAEYPESIFSGCRVQPSLLKELWPTDGPGMADSFLSLESAMYCRLKERMESFESRFLFVI